ncbi:GH25 family lysozyme [Micromonospora sagamiensis]|uniref:Lysozyme n=1 Tax=Micromonospora sagamiensis TaxID=47875 RepID=A0A562WGQ8_9ACTN|nr:GH25 family lysozyme [Micromonospora sagamiensis]TWJ29500.1 GH25 family lysozyme M1 (1,4-beta-N-acetylmuramidase) [Micromonospora sagamiensis]BCL17472.1 hydrolase [Micromonospora sagamiensis]
MPRPAVHRLARRLLATTLAVAATATALVAATGAPAQAATTAGIDVSHHQGSINWTSVRDAGVEFAFIKATEGTSYKDPAFNTNYVAAYHAGVVRGAYHFALPDRSSGATQANYLASSGGAWSADSRTLPAALDIEYNPYGPACYGLSQSAMRTWIADFLDTYRARTGRYAVVYTTTNWWTTCTGNWSGPWANHPLWIARWSTSPGTLPAGAPFWSFWQYTSTGRVSGISGDVDRNYFNGDRSRLIALANNT